MIITNKLQMDLHSPGITPIIHAVQNDSYSRNLEIALFADRQPFVFPVDGTVVIRYKKADGKGGEYDTLPNGSTAWWTQGNHLTVALAPQVLTTPGSVFLSVSLIADGNQLSMFPIRLAVEPIAAGKIAASENYFYITGLLPAPVSGKAGQLLRIADVNSLGRITAVEAVDNALPQKGIDYWTDADRASMIQDVLTALDCTVFGSPDTDNNIVLTGTLPDGTYTLKYDPGNGSITTIGILEHSSGESAANQIPLSTDFDGSIFNGTGYALGKRIDSSSQIKDVANPAASNPVILTGFIPVSTGDVVQLENCYMHTAAVSASEIYGNDPYAFNSIFYDTEKAELDRVQWTSMTGTNSWLRCSADSQNNVTEFTVTGTAAYMRLHLAPTGSPSEAAVIICKENPDTVS